MIRPAKDWFIWTSRTNAGIRGDTSVCFVLKDAFHCSLFEIWVAPSLDFEKAFHAVTLCEAGGSGKAGIRGLALNYYFAFCYSFMDYLPCFNLLSLREERALGQLTNTAVQFHINFILSLCKLFR